MKNVLNNFTIGTNLETQFIDIIRDRLGIVIKPDNLDLKKTIQNACEKFQCNPAQYLAFLMKNNVESPYLDHLISGITIGETYFFRDKNQMRILSEFILPSIIQHKRTSQMLSIRAWSAGCSSGEEIYTVSMMLQELLPDIDRWQIHLLATDINVNVLKKAMSGRYSEWSMRSIPDSYKNRYFTQIENYYQLTEKIMRSVEFDYLNLTEDIYPSPLNNTFAQDLIICRNVLIYFDNVHIDLLMSRISKCLVPTGFLLLGSSDPVNLASTQLVRSKESPSLCVYADTEEAEKKIVQPVNNFIMTTPLTKQVDELISSRVYVNDKVVANVNEKYVQVEKLMQKGQWAEVVAEIDRLGDLIDKDAFYLTSKASALANLGQTNEAIKCCLKSTAIDQTNPWSYFILALAYSEQNDIAAAESSFRKALYLDHKFIICYFQFGLFLIRHGQPAEGYKMLNNALKIATEYPPDENVPYANEVSYRRIIEILEHELELYE